MDVKKVLGILVVVGVISELILRSYPDLQDRIKSLPNESD